MLVMPAATVVITSGCATAFVRSKDTVDPQYVFPATSLDTQFFWNSAVKGEPFLATADPTIKNGPAARLAYGVGPIIDLPFSVVCDTILLPVDLFRSKKTDEKSNIKQTPDNSTR